jgi:hypothetical protein
MVPQVLLVLLVEAAFKQKSLFIFEQTIDGDLSNETEDMFIHGHVSDY